jgi:hypothetical protein
VIRGTLSADLDGNRLDGETICRTDNKRWMPYGYDKPVRLDAGKLKNKKKWKKRFEGMSPATRAKLFALAR